MTIQPSPSRTLTPAPGSYGGGCACGDIDLAWPCKDTDQVLDYWLDASLECADAGVNVLQWGYNIYYGDGALLVKQQIQDGNKSGLLLGAGTPGTTYGARMIATMTDGRVLTWDVSLPIINEAPTLPITNAVTVNDLALTYCGLTLPVAED